MSEENKQSQTEGVVAVGSKELLGATVTVTVNKTHRIELGSNPAYHRVAFVMSHLPECFRGYWMMRELPDGTDEKTDYLTIVKDGDKFWAIPPCGF